MADQVLEHCDDDPPPIPMVLHCPRCGTQHIDQATAEWDNPPHRSHACQKPGCGCIWRPCDLPTTGVADVGTTGKADNYVPGGGRDLADYHTAVCKRVDRLLPLEGGLVEYLQSVRPDAGITRETIADWPKYSHGVRDKLHQVLGTGGRDGGQRQAYRRRNGEP